MIVSNYSWVNHLTRLVPDCRNAIIEANIEVIDRVSN